MLSAADHQEFMGEFDQLAYKYDLDAGDVFRELAFDVGEHAARRLQGGNYDEEAARLAALEAALLDAAEAADYPVDYSNSNDIDNDSPAQETFDHDDDYDDDYGPMCSYYRE